MRRIGKTLGFLLCTLTVLLVAGCGAAYAETVPTEMPTEITTLPVTEPSVTEHIHAYEEYVVEPMCTEGGYTEYVCACGDTYQDAVTQAVGHDETETLVEATEAEPGYTEHTCQRCGESYRDQYVWLAETATDFFDDAAFLGDSITMGLRNYTMKYPYLGKATFLCQTSYSVNHAVNNSMYITYRGEDAKPQNALARSGVKKVFILLGMNDIGLHGVDKTIERWAILVENIRSTCPDIAIYIQSGTPIYNGGEKGSLNNTNMDAYNEKLKAFAEANGCYYIDIATAMKDEANALAAEYCSDKYVHLTYPACKLWVALLKNSVIPMGEETR